MTYKTPLFAFLLVGIIWGSNFIYMKIALEFITPPQVVFFRVLFGLIPVLIIGFAYKNIKIAHIRHFKHYFIMSLLATVIYYYGFVKGTALLYSGIAGALSGTIPLFSFLLTFVFLKDEKMSIINIFGVILGFIGVLIIARPNEIEALNVNIEGVLYILMGSLSVGASFVYARKFIVPLKIPPLALTSYQLLIGLIILSLTIDYSGIEYIFTNTYALLGLSIGLGVLGTGVAYVIYYYIVSKYGAVKASSSTYIPPVVALFIGSFLVGEPIELIDYVATLLIFTGVFLLSQNYTKNTRRITK